MTPIHDLPRVDDTLTANVVIAAMTDLARRAEGPDQLPTDDDIRRELAESYGVTLSPIDLAYTLERIADGEGVERIRHEGQPDRWVVFA